MAGGTSVTSLGTRQAEVIVIGSDANLLAACPPSWLIRSYSNSLAACPPHWAQTPLTAAKLRRSLRVCPSPSVKLKWLDGQAKLPKAIFRKPI